MKFVLDRATNIGTFREKEEVKIDSVADLLKLIETHDNPIVIQRASEWSRHPWRIIIYDGWLE